MSCTGPIETAVLAGYWLGELSGPEEERLEEHLLGCAPCAARLQECIALAEGVRTLAREGSLAIVVSDTFLDCAARDGVRIREYAPPSGGSVQCTVTADDDLLIGRLAADLNNATRVDLRIFDSRGMERFRMDDIPFHPDAGSVAFQYSITHAKAAPTESIIARLIAFDVAGRERLLGEYTFHHTRTLPGPGKW